MLYIFYPLRASLATSISVQSVQIPEILQFSMDGRNILHISCDINNIQTTAANSKRENDCLSYLRKAMLRF